VGVSVTGLFQVRVLVEELSVLERDRCAPGKRREVLSAFCIVGSLRQAAKHLRHPEIVMSTQKTGGHLDVAPIFES
jgi:hypothetical protein